MSSISSAAGNHLILWMTISFENDNDVMVYALDKIIAFARNNQYIILAQCVWWIFSIIRLQARLVTHMKHLLIRSEVASVTKDVPATKTLGESIDDRQDRILTIISPTPREIQGESRSSVGRCHIHPDTIPQVKTSSYHTDNDEPRDQEATRLQLSIVSDNEMIKLSEKERRALAWEKNSLTCTRSGRVPSKPKTKKQKNYSPLIPQDTIA